MDEMDRLLLAAAKEQAEALPTQSVWEALCRRRERDKRLRRTFRQLAAGAAMLALGFLGGMLGGRMATPAEPAVFYGAPRLDGDPAISIPKTDGMPEPVVTVPPHIGLPAMTETEGQPETPPGIVGVPKTDGGLVPVTLGDFALPNLVGIGSLSEMEFTWLPADYTIEIADEGVAMAWLYDKDGEAALTFNLYHAQDDRPYDGDGLPPGMGRCTIKVGQDSNCLYSISWTLWLTEDVWVNADTSWLSLPDTVALMQGIVKRTGG